MSLEGWTIETTLDGGDYCLDCGGLIEDCGDDCPVLQIIADHMEKNKNAG